MDIRNLRHVVVLSRARNYGRAARELNLSQPALSRSIQSVEERFGVKLFNRGRGSVVPTPVGHQFVQQACEVLLQFGTLEHNLRLVNSQILGDANFGMSPIPGMMVLPAILTEIARHHSGLNINAVIRSASELSRLLLADQIEFFVCSEGVFEQSPQISTTPLFSVQPSLFVRPAHPLLELKVVHAVDVSAFPIIGTRTLMSPVTRGAAKRSLYEATLNCEDHHVLYEVTMNSDAVGVAWRGFARTFAYYNKLKELHPPKDERLPAYTQVLGTIRGRELSPTAKLVIDKIKSMKSGK